MNVAALALNNRICCLLIALVLVLVCLILSVAVLSIVGTKYKNQIIF